MSGAHKRTFFRLGYGFSRQRNGAANMHAALCIPAVTGAWAHEGGGALHASGAVYKLDRTLIQGLDARDDSVRRLDQSRVGEILTGDRDALKGGGPVKAMLIQNTNPMVVAPDQEKVRQGFAREDLFVCVHEQFMTDTARFADVVLPATMFLEHDDIYTASAHQFLQFAPKTIDPPEECRSNHEVICALARRLGAEHRGFEMSPREIIDETLRVSGRGTLAELEAGTLARLPASVRATRISSTALLTATASFISAPTGRTFLMTTTASAAHGAVCLRCPTIGRSTKGRTRPIPSSSRLRPRATSSIRASTRPRPRLPARAARARSCTPHDMARLGLHEGDVVRLGNARGEIRVHVKPSAGATRGVIVSEGLWDNRDFLDGRGVNTLTGADSVAPFGGAAFHDVRVWARRDVARAAVGEKATAETAALS